MLQQFLNWCLVCEPGALGTQAGSVRSDHWGDLGTGGQGDRGQGTGALRISKIEEMRTGACYKQGPGLGFGDGQKRPEGRAGAGRELG